LEIEYINDIYNNGGSFEIEKWDIAYPIERVSFFNDLKPKGYLTITDMDWKSIIESIFE